MKKLIIAFFAAFTLAACNNDGSSTEEVKDSVLEAIDSTGDARVDSVKEATDSLEQKVENTFDKTDSANKALADTVKKN